jgi:hypothetical protein
VYNSPESKERDLSWIIWDKEAAESLLTMQELIYKKEESVFLNRFGIVLTHLP